MPPRMKANSSLGPKISAPADRVYKSATPLQQSRLPAIQRRVQPKYGKKRLKLAKQETLTQIGYVSVKTPEPEAEEEELYHDTDGDYEEEAKSRKKKRRKTEGDVPDGTPTLHTQRLTQMEWSFSSTSDQIDDLILEMADKPDEPILGPSDHFDDSIFDIPSSAPRLPAQPSKRARSRKMKEGLEKLPEEPPINAMPTPQTPHRILAREIPSSQSPATPISILSKGSGKRSPLKETSVNLSIPFNPGRRSDPSPGKVPKLEIRDTFDTVTDVSQLTRIPSSPPKRPSPAKSVRFALPAEEEDELEQPPSPSARIASTPRFTGRKEEILDSDADSDEDLDDNDEPAEVLSREASIEAPESVELGNYEQFEEFELPIGPAGTLYASNHETEVEEHRSRVSESADIIASEEATGELAEQESQEQEITPVDQDNQDNQENEEEPDTCYGDIGMETQFEVSKLMTSSVVNASSRVMQAEHDETNHIITDATSEHDESHRTFTAKSQMMESQRLSTQHVHAMAERTPGSDVFISISHQNVKNMITGVKDHETRNWALSPTVNRLWIYETAPVSAVRYMAEIGSAKVPGQITDVKGIGNTEFNAKGPTWRAYEILQLYELADPKSLSELKELGWLKAAPRKTAPVAPAVIDELIANLLPPLFPTASEQDAPVSSSTDTQEAADQLLSNIRQFTQPLIAPDSSPIPGPNLGVESSEERILSSPSPIRTLRMVPPPIRADTAQPASTSDRIASSPSPPATVQKFRRPPPSQATTVDLSQTQTPRHHSQAEVVFESPARPVASSPLLLRLPSQRYENGDKLRDQVEDQEPESLVPYSMASSQLMTKTQLLSDSLLMDCVPGPPPFVLDSDEEDSDED